MRAFHVAAVALPLLLGAGGTQCSGDSSREFTLTKGGSGWGVSGMTGQAP